MSQLRVSAKYWDSLRKIEKDYILSRYEIDGLQYLKTIVSEARKQLKGFDRIYGNGMVEKDSVTYRFSGNDTRKFKKV